MTYKEMKEKIQGFDTNTLREMQERYQLEMEVRGDTRNLEIKWMVEEELESRGEI